MKKSYSNKLFSTKSTQKTFFSENTQSFEIGKEYTKKDLERNSAAKALGQLNIPKQGSFQFQRLIDQIGASLWQ